ncbi:MAG TPA: AAA family ATPase [Clostridia bacterium]|nr:AAA family ATPase [Clostridia bacterium]
MRIERLEIKGFGKLKDRVIELKDGLNILYGGNEAGKSTLQIFICGMLYGLKNGRQAAGLSSPLKRYEPWDGVQYGGAMVFSLDNGSMFRVERNFKTGEVRLFDGLYSDITGEFGIGRDKSPLFADRLLGMDETTFTRTAFVRQMELRLGEDASEALAARLANAASAGVDDISFSKAEKAISDALKNGIGTGRTRTQPLDRLEDRLAQLEEASGRLSSRRERTFAARKELQEARERCQRLEAGEKYMDGIERLIELRQTLDGYMKKESVLKNAARQLKELEAAGTGYSGESGGNETEVVLRRKRQDGSLKWRKLLLPIVCAAFACLLALFVSGLAGVRLIPLPVPVSGIGALISAVAAVLVYRYKGRSGFSKAANKAAAPGYTEYHGIEGYEMKKEMILKEAAFSCGRQLASPAALEQELHGISQGLEKLSADLESGIEAAVASGYESEGYFNPGVLDAVIYDSDTTVLNEAWQTENREIKRELLDAALKIKYCEGLLGDDNEVSEELERVTEETIAVREKITYLKIKGNALKLALEVLTESGAELRRSFVPDVNRRMSTIISALTAGKYTDLKGNDRLSLNAALPDGGVRSVMSLSGGTEDQVYLALRLALAELLTAGGESLPLIFDEVFSQFDDRRTSLALQYLHNTYNRKQILIFTCKQREIELVRDIYGNGMNFVGLEYEQTAC